MGIIERITRPFVSAALDQRAFVTGPGVVDASLAHYGFDSDTFNPPEYGDYIATSNGVYACVNLRARNLSSLPLRIYTGKGEKRTEQEAGPLRDLLDQVNPYWTFERLIEMTEQSLCLWGEAHWFLERGKSATRPPVEMWWARPDKVRVVPHPDNYVSHFLYKPDVGGPEIKFETSEVIWFRLPNPINQFEGLSPLAAARLAADTASAAMHSNKNLFANGIQMGGVVVPSKGAGQLTDEQAKTLEAQITSRFKGVDKAHRWGVLRFEADFKPLAMTPKDAEFLGMLGWALEDICRAFGVPLDLIGGQRTYENVQAAERMLWSQTLKPQARFIANEITEQLLPMFGKGLTAEFDLADVEALHEAETDKWMRWKEQITTGAVTINEWRADTGLKPVEWGDVWWAQSTLTPVENAEKPEPPPQLQDAGPAALPAGDDDALPDKDNQADDERRRGLHRSLAYGSPEHVKHWQRFIAQTDPWERKVEAVCRDLFQRQKASILANLTRSKRAEADDEIDAAALSKAEELAAQPFDKARWIKSFRVEMRPVLRDIVDDAGQLAVDEMAVATAWNVQEPAVSRFIEQRAQRFAVHVNETTWETLRTSLSDGIKNGEGILDLQTRVEQIMGDRIRSSSETIARTETIGAMNGGTQEAWKQTGVVAGKEWIAALDDRTRETHIEAHEQRVALDEDFTVGMGSGPGPGQIGLAEEDINCRCSMLPILDTEGI